MNFKHLVSRQTFNNISRINGRLSSRLHENGSTIPATICTLDQSLSSNSSKPFQNPQCPKPNSSFTRFIHFTRATRVEYSGIDLKLDSDDSIMFGKLSESYSNIDKKTVDGMLLVIVEKVVSEIERDGVEQMLGSAVSTLFEEFSEDLWKRMWEVSNMGLDDMKKATKKEKMKKFLHSEKVKEICRFAGEIGIKGDMFRELMFKWAREKMEESEFYEGLESLREEERAENKGKEAEGNVDEEVVVAEEKPNIRYKIYGLDLSNPKWAEVANKVHEAGEMIWLQEPKPISGKCKLVTEKILSLNEKDVPSPLLVEWVEHLQPSRIDWMNLLYRLKEKNLALYFKVNYFISLFYYYCCTSQSASSIFNLLLLTC
ncbi:hypothetical protein UlMin_034241 [Ulmus minor]